MDRPGATTRALPPRQTKVKPVPVRREPAANASNGGATTKEEPSRWQWFGGKSSNPPPIVLPLRSCCFHRKQTAGGEEATGKLQAKEVHRSRARVEHHDETSLVMATTTTSSQDTRAVILPSRRRRPLHVSPPRGAESRTGGEGNTDNNQPLVVRPFANGLDEGHRLRGHRVTRRQALAQAARGRCDNTVVDDLPLVAIVGWR